MNPVAGRVWKVRDNPGFAGALLLDTHVWFWMLTGETARMHRETGELLQRSASHGQLHISDISCWEVAQKAGRGLNLGLPADAWITQAVAVRGVTLLPLSRDVLVAGALLHELHGDPADRWIVATAKLHRLTVATADRAVIEFARHEGLTDVCDVRR